MDIGELRDFCLSLKGAEESMSFDDETFVLSVKGKMFRATDINTYEFVNLRYDPDEATQSREQYNEVTEGYYMNKKYWNNVKTKGKITNEQFQEWIKDSYDLVALVLPKKIQKELNDE